MYKKSSHTRRKPYKSHKRHHNMKSKVSSLKSLIRRVATDQETAQHFIQNENAQSLAQSVLYTQNLVSPIAIGTGNNKRTSEEIHLEAIKCRFTLLNPYATLNDVSNIRIMLVKSNQQYAAGGSWSISGFSNSTLFLNNPGNPTSDGMPDPKLVTVYYDKVHTLQPCVPLQPCIKTIVETIRLDQKFIYETGTTWAKQSNLYFVVSACVASGTGGVTNAGTIVLNSDLIFKNSK